MAKPNYQPVLKGKFNALKEDFDVAPRDQLVAEMRGLFGDVEFPVTALPGELIYLKKDNTLALADRLQADKTDFSFSVRVDYADMLESLKGKR